MAIWRLTDRAVSDLARGAGALWIDLTNTDAAQFNTVMVYKGAFDNANATVSDFLNCGPAHGSGGSQANNVARKAIGATAFTASSSGQPTWGPTTSVLNYEVSGGSCEANLIAVYAMYPGTDDSDRNVIAIGNLGAQSIASGSNLKLTFTDSKIITGDDPST